MFHPPVRKHHRSPEEFGLEMTTTRIHCPDGVAVELWTQPGDSQGTVVLGHGIGLSRSASLAHAKIAHDLGFNVVLLDHRGHGGSGLDPSATRMAWGYQMDVLSAVEWARNHFRQPDPVVGWGFSFSTYPTLAVLARPGSGLSAVILDSGPSANMQDSLMHFLHHNGLGRNPLLRAATHLPGIGQAFALGATDVLTLTWPPSPAEADVSHAPKLFLVGLHDPYVDAQQVHELAASLGNAEVLDMECGHLGGLKACPEQYRAAVTNFLRQVRTEYVAKTTSQVYPSLASRLDANR